MYILAEIIFVGVTMSPQNVSQPLYICNRNSRNNLLFPDYNAIFVSEEMIQNKPLIISGLWSGA